jgi:hypothetical protein
MAKSRSEALLREAFPFLSLRGAEGDEAISKGSPRGRQHCLARADKPYRASSPPMGEDRGEGAMGSLI